MKLLRSIKSLIFLSVLKIKLLMRRKNMLNYFLFDVPEYGNLGDQAIFYAEKKFLKDKKNINNLITIKSYYIDNERCYNYLIKKINNKDIIFLTGGGSLDENGYIVVNRFIKIIRDLKDNKIIIFPQTINFHNDTRSGKELLKKTKEAFEKHNKLHIFVREKKSFNFAQENYNCNIYLVPDIVLYLNNSIKKYRKNSKILLLFRKDKESIVNNTLKNNVINLLVEKGEKIEFSDSFVGSKIFKNRGKYFINSYIDLLLFWKKCAMSNLIITDRLHGMIFGFITKTKTIAFNNSNGKISGVYKWLSNSNYIKFVTNFNQFNLAMDELNSIDHINDIDFSKSYDKIIEVLDNE